MIHDLAETTGAVMPVTALVVPENLIGGRNPGVLDRGWIASRA
jgi:hypothetical protein